MSAEDLYDSDDGLDAEDAIEVIEQDGDMDMDDESDLEEEEEEDNFGPDDSIAHFAGHSSEKRNPVYCLAVNPKTALIAASGGQDDMGYIWSTADGQEIAKLSGHTDTVVAVAFSNDGEFIATGGMDGKIRLWRRVKAQSSHNDLSEWSRWEFLTSLEGPDEVTALLWHPRGSVLCAGSKDGTVWMWNLPTGKTMSIFSGHTSSIVALNWVSPTEGKRLLSASESSEVYLWDPKEPYSAPVLKFSPTLDSRFAFENGITSVAVNTAGSLALIAGAQDATLKIINLTSGHLVSALTGAHRSFSSIEALAWVDVGPSTGLWMSGASDGTICAWEGSTGALRWKAEHPQPEQPEENQHSNGNPKWQDIDTDMNAENQAQEADQDTERIAISCLSLHPSKSLVTSAAADGSLRTWDVRSGKLVTEYLGHSRAIHALAVSQDNALILSGGDNGLVRVHRV